MTIEGKVCVIAGAGKIGKKLAHNLCDAGAIVILGDNNPELVKILKKENYHTNLIIKHLDIANEGSVTDLIVYFLKERKTCDAWINTAFPKNMFWKPENLCGRFMFDWNISRHLWGYYDTSFKIANLIMREQGFGSVINFGSIYGVNAPDFSIYEGTDMIMPIWYAMIKGAINMMSKYFASYYGKYNIRFNVVSPGGVFEGQDPAFVKNYKKKVPLGRMAVEEDLFGIIKFLISDDSKYITGQNFMVDGGWTIW